MRALLTAVGLVGVLCLACSSPTAVPDAGATGAADPLRPWSRDAAVVASARAADAGPPVLEGASAEALDELLAAAERAAPPTPTDPDGGTRIGTDTGVDPGATAAPHASASRAATVRAPRIGVGVPEMEPAVSSPAVEREGRAQLYWNLVQRCRGPDGAILPPDVVTLRFTIDADGYIVPGTIQSTAAEPRWQQAASCMLRELSATSFRLPPSARGVAARVTATVPSVD